MYIYFFLFNCPQIINHTLFYGHNIVTKKIYPVLSLQFIKMESEWVGGYFWFGFVFRLLLLA